MNELPKSASLLSLPFSSTGIAGVARRFRPLSLTLLLLVLAGCSTAPPDSVKPVTGFDADRYLGQWYELARLDHRFERGMSSVTANYSLREDGGIKVLNRGYKADKGEWTEAEGKAYFLGEPSIGSLEVSFFGPFSGGYHIMSLDEGADDYGWSLVSGPSLDYLWILSRTPQLPKETLDGLVAQAASAGFPVDDLIFVDHSDHETP